MQSENKTEFSNDLILLALTKIDSLVRSNSELATGIGRLNVIIGGVENNWRDLKEELRQTRHDYKDYVRAANELYQSHNERILTLEKEKERREAVEMQKEHWEEKRNTLLQKRIMWTQIMGGTLLAILAAFHVSWKRVLESIAGLL